MKSGLSCYTVVRNAIELDYPVELTIRSLLSVASEVVVGLADSTDGTTDMLEAMAREHPKIRLIRQPWNNPTQDVQWFVRWINQTREHLRFDRQLFLDADEVLDPNCHDILRNAFDPDEAFAFHRLNYWRDAHHLVPHGRCCSHLVTRYGATRHYMPSDEIYGGHDFPGPEPEIRLIARRHPALVIHHLGFLRKREALFAKCRVVLRAFFGGYDSRLEEAEKHPDVHWTTFAPFDEPLIPYAGNHPELAMEWLRERGAL